MTRFVMAIVLICSGEEDNLAPATGIVVAVLIMIVAIAIGYCAWVYLTPEPSPLLTGGSNG